MYSSFVICCVCRSSPSPSNYIPHPLCCSFNDTLNHSLILMIDVLLLLLKIFLIIFYYSSTSVIIPYYNFIPFNLLCVLIYHNISSVRTCNIPCHIHFPFGTQFIVSEFFSTIQCNSIYIFNLYQLNNLF